MRVLTRKIKVKLECSYVIHGRRCRYRCAFPENETQSQMNKEGEEGRSKVVEAFLVVAAMFRWEELTDRFARIWPITGDVGSWIPASRDGRASLGTARP
jgi:hypothetical protein